MKLFICFCLMIVSSLSFAITENAYDVRVDLKDKYNNNSNHVLVSPGKVSSVFSKANGVDQFIDVNASESKEVPDAITIKLTTGTMDRNGNRTVLSTHEVLTKNNESKQISINADKGSDATNITVQPTRRTL